MAHGMAWTAQELVDRLDLEPMPLQGGMFRRLWTGEPGPDGRPTGTSIMVLIAVDHGTYSAMHRLPVDEVWHFYLGDPIDLLLLAADGSTRSVRLGHDLAAGQHVQYPVPAGTWMGARVVAGGNWSLYGCTMAPGFVPSDYEGGGVELSAAYPEAAAEIAARLRPGAPLRHPSGGGGTDG